MGLHWLGNRACSARLQNAIGRKLQGSMQNFIAGEWRRAHTLKRGGGVETLSLDFDSAEQTYGLEPSSGLDPEAAYQRRWAMDLLDRAVGDVREQYRRAGNSELFDALKGYLGAADDVLPYSELAGKLGKSEGSLRVAATRLRARWPARSRATARRRRAGVPGTPAPPPTPARCARTRAPPRRRG